MPCAATVKPVYNDHLMGYFSVLWSSNATIPSFGKYDINTKPVIFPGWTTDLLAEMRG